MTTAGEATRRHVVVVGCGFGGLAAVRSLDGADADITVIDRRNQHVFQPLLYQVATAGLNPSDIAQPIRRILRKQQNVRVLLDEVEDIDVDEHTLATASGQTIGYDTLVLATGATHSYFGNDGWSHHAPGLKTLEDALDIRRRILLGFERAEATEDPADRRRLMTFVVVGAGPTGVELAGAVKEIATRTLRSDFRSIDTSDCRVVLLEAGPRVLPAFPEKLSASAERQLVDLGVEVKTSTPVTDIDEGGVRTDRGRIEASTVLWAAGVAASSLGARLPVPHDRAGRVEVGPDLSITGHPEVFVIGDLASSRGPNDQPVPGVAPAAQQGGEHVGRCIRADLDGAERPTFRYRNKGSLATIGRSSAVADLSPRLQFGGFFAWLIWWAVHIWSLVDYSSRMRTMSGWAYQYVFDRRNARLITDSRRSEE